MSSSTDKDRLLGTTGASQWQGRGKWIVAGLGLLILLFLLGYCVSQSGSAQNFATAPVERHDLNVAITATGKLVPTRQVNVGSEESGLVEEVYVRNNDRVRKGQPIARLDLARLRDTLAQSKAALQGAVATVAQARATVAQSETKLARQMEVFRLSEGKIPSRDELDAARADHQRAVADLAKAQAEVSQARATASTNRTRLSKGTIYAPVTGVVLSQQIEPGQTVAATFNVATLFTIAENLSTLKLQVRVDEADVGGLRPGAIATFTVDAYPGKRFPATVEHIDVGANATPQVNSIGNVVTSTSTVVAYTAELRVDNPRLLLKPGMTATATIVTETARNALLVPNAALRFVPPPPPKGGLFASPPVEPKAATVSRGGRQKIWTVEPNGYLRFIPVTVGRTNGSLTEVSGDLKPGLKVVTGLLADSGQ